MAKGFSLIELLITIAIIAFLAMVALPMTSAWIDGPDVTRTQTNFARAYSLAKNIAIREGAAVTPNGATSALCVTSADDGTKTVSVVKQSGEVGDAAGRTPADCQAATLAADPSPVVFSAELRPNVSIQYGTAAPLTDFTCACFTNNGAIAPNTTTNCSAANNCLDGSVANNNQFTFNKGSVNETATLF